MNALAAFAGAVDVDVVIADACAASLVDVPGLF
jgi:hypothetical protein